jgi:hypothetical protein
LSSKINREEDPKRSHERECKRFHSRWLKQVTPAVLDAVETADEVGKAVEDAVELPKENCAMQGIISWGLQGP